MVRGHRAPQARRDCRASSGQSGSSSSSTRKAISQAGCGSERRRSAAERVDNRRCTRFAVDSLRLCLASPDHRVHKHQRTASGPGVAARTRDLGAGFGLILAGAASKVFRALAANLPRVEEIHLDARIVLYTLLCSIAATFLCGLFPAIRSARRTISLSLAQSSGTQVSTRSTLQWLLVGVQVALAVTLLAGAGLLVRSFVELGRVSPGFDPTHVLTFHISASWGETTDMKGLTQRINHIIDSLSATPGVESAATAGTLPGIPFEHETEFKFADAASDPNRKIMSGSRAVSPSYFATMRIPLLAGELCRESTAAATADKPGAVDALVNRSFVNAYLTGS